VTVAGTPGSGKTTLARRLARVLDIPPLLLQRAEVLVWLDLPVATVMRQVVGRTVRRGVRRETLWNGNVEPPLWTLVRRGDQNILDWAWTTRHRLAGLDRRLKTEAPRLVLVRLRSRTEVERWVRGVSEALGRDRP
jgi:adenylate kinase family enzyme